MTMIHFPRFLSLRVFLTTILVGGGVAFTPSARQFPLTTRFNTRQTPLLAFFDKMFEEEGPLGKGITVGKVQVALTTTDRSSDSVFGALQRAVRKNQGSTNYDLACLTQEVCLSLLRRRDSWTAASSASQWFKEDDAGRAESLYNEWANREAVKFEKEYPIKSAEDAGATVVVVSILLELVGDRTQFDGAGLSFGQTEEVLQSIASDVMVEEGDCVNAAEVFWVPGEANEALTSMDLVVDFPELMTI